MKTILVTGATAGFGAAFARRFIKDGHRVIATGRRVERLQALAAELGPNLFATPLDMTDVQAVADFVPSLPEAWRRIDVLVNNAGLALGLSPAWEASLDHWDQMIATNVTGLVHLTRADAAANGRARRRPDHQSRLGRRRLRLSRRPCLWRHQSLRPAIFVELALGPRRPERARDQYRTGHGDGLGILPGAIRRRRRPRRRLSMPARNR